MSIPGISEEQLAEMKQQCPFCRIIAGEIPSREVFSDDLLTSILDIHPATKGHVLFMPKEHYPILPLLPEEVSRHLFVRSVQLAKAIRDALLVPGSSIFIANGGVAGQQSPHFLMHIIPREPGDILEKWDSIGGSIDQSPIFEAMHKNIGIVMGKLYGKKKPIQNPNIPLLAPKPAEDSSTSTAQELASVKEKQLQENQKNFQAALVNDPPQKENPLKESANENHVILAEILQENPDIKQALIDDPDKFILLLEQDVKLKELFAGIDVKTLANRLRSLKEKNATTKEESKSDLDKISSLFLGG